MSQRDNWHGEIYLDPKVQEDFFERFGRVWVRNPDSPVKSEEFERVLSANFRYYKLKPLVM